jgi:hypothetical protein
MHKARETLIIVVVVQLGAVKIYAAAVGGAQEEKGKTG